MGSIIESEEEIACLSREIEEELDQIDSVIMWLLSQNYIEATIDEILKMVDVAQLKALNLDLGMSYGGPSNVTASSPWEVNISENLEKLRQLTAVNAEPLENMFAQLRSGAMQEELENLRLEIGNVRTKKFNMLQDLNAKKKLVGEEEIEMATFIDILKEINGETKAAVISHEQDLRKADMSTEVNYELGNFFDMFEL